MSATEKLQVLGEVVRRFLAVTAEWHEDLPASLHQGGLAFAAISLHAANFGLWHCEDQARRTNSPDAQVVKFKLAIDRLNVQRNRTIEEIDRLVLRHLRASDEAEFCSDTGGMIVDRPSALSLRQFHVERRLRSGPTDPAREPQVQVLELQTLDLTRALDTLFDDLVAGRKRFYVYQQFKGVAPKYCPRSEGIEKLVGTAHGTRNR
jgi:hypothetical protein